MVEERRGFIVDWDVETGGGGSRRGVETAAIGEDAGKRAKGRHVESVREERTKREEEEEKEGKMGILEYIAWPKAVCGENRRE